MYPFRIGFGYDVHQLVEGRPLFIGGVKIDHYKGALGHSDADVLLHAVCDALLGAAGLRDIGHYFPDTSDDFKGIESRLLLVKTNAIIGEKGWQIGNIDCTIALQKPKIASHIEEMKSNIAAVLGLETRHGFRKGYHNRAFGLYRPGRRHPGMGSCPFIPSIILCMNIRLVQNKDLDKTAWDNCIGQAVNGNIYAFSWYLDIVCDEWDALVSDNYETVFPLTFRKKFGIWYLYQPFFTQQLGIFSIRHITPQIVEEFLAAIPAKYKFAEINLNAI